MVVAAHGSSYPSKSYHSRAHQESVKEHGLFGASLLKLAVESLFPNQEQNISSKNEFAA